MALPLHLLSTALAANNSDVPPRWVRTSAYQPRDAASPGNLPCTQFLLLLLSCRKSCGCGSGSGSAGVGLVKVGRCRGEAAAESLHVNMIEEYH